MGSDVLICTIKCASFLHYQAWVYFWGSLKLPGYPLLIYFEIMNSSPIFWFFICLLNAHFLVWCIAAEHDALLGRIECISLDGSAWILFSEVSSSPIGQCDVTFEDWSSIKFHFWSWFREWVIIKMPWSNSYFMLKMECRKAGDCTFSSCW